MAASMVVVAIHAAKAHRTQNGQDFPVAARRGFMDALAREGARIGPRHRSRNTAFVKEDQMFRHDRPDRGDELFAALEVGYCVALSGVERLFFSRRPSLRTRYPTRPRLNWTGASRLSFAVNSVKVRSGCARPQAIACLSAAAPACRVRPG